MCIYKTKKKPGLKPGFGKELTTRISVVEGKLEAHSQAILELSRQVDFWKSKAGGSVSSLSANHSYPEISNGNNLNHTNTSSINLNTNSKNSSSIINRFKEKCTPEEPALKLMPCSEHKLPSADLLRDLVDLYFKRFHPQFPILHPEITRDRLLGYIENRIDKCWPMLLLAIATVTLRWVPTSQISSELRNDYYNTCKQKLILQSLNITNIECLQALVLLAIDMVGVSNGPQTWGILALICSAAVHLGICKEQIIDSNESLATKMDEVIVPARDPVEAESRRRLFWGIYMLDRFSSVSTSFAFRINENDIDRMLPIQESLWLTSSISLPKTRWLKTPNRTDYTTSNPQFIDPFGHLLEILQILAMIHDFLRKAVNIYSLEDVIQWQMRYRQLDQQIDDWHNSLTLEYTDINRVTVNGDNDTLNGVSLQGSSTGELNPMLVMLHATHYTTIMRLHSSAGYAFLKSEFFTSSPSAAQKCRQAVKSMTTLAKLVSSHSTWEYLGPHYAWTLWVSARLLLVDCVTNHQAMPTDLEFLLSALKQMGKYWRVAARYWEILTLVIDEELSLRKNHRNSVDTTSDISGGSKMSSTQILSDMRRNAYALDFLLSDSRKPDSTDSPNGFSNDHNTSLASVSPSLETEDLENINGMFDWFNLPKQQDAGVIQPSAAVHSLDEYKNILSRDHFSEGYHLLDQQQDWLSKSALSDDDRL